MDFLLAGLVRNFNMQMFLVSLLKQWGGWAGTGCEAWHDGFRTFLYIDTTPSENWNLILIPGIWARLSDPILVSGMWCYVPARARSEKGQLLPASWISCHVVGGSSSCGRLILGWTEASHQQAASGWGAPTPVTAWTDSTTLTLTRGLRSQIPDL